MKQEPSTGRDAKALQSTARPILGDDSFERRPDVVSQNDVMESFISVAAFEDIGEFATWGGNVHDRATFVRRRRSGHLRDDRADLISDAYVPSIALGCRKLQSRLSERAFITRGMRLQEKLENVSFHCFVPPPP
jgi:hypothetical protein